LLILDILYLFAVIVNTLIALVVEFLWIWSQQLFRKRNLFSRD